MSSFLQIQKIQFWGSSDNFWSPKNNASLNKKWHFKINLGFLTIFCSKKPIQSLAEHWPFILSVILALSVPSHFIHPALHFLRHFIPKGKIVTSYQALHTSALHTMRHFISKSLHTSALHTKVTSYRCTSYQGHFIPVTSYRLSLHTNALHTKVTSYQCTSYQSHFIPRSFHTKVKSVTSYQCTAYQCNSY